LGVIVISPLYQSENGGGFLHFESRIFKKVGTAADPRADIRTLERVEFAMKGGRIHRRDDARGAMQ
jgi:hypothetical protein